jgi:mannonate dehydratase
VFEGCKRFVELVDSPYNGLNFCCGTAAEGLENPKTELIPIVKYFAERKKIFNIHFRNIVGGLQNFSEVRPPVLCSAVLLHVPHWLVSGRVI